MPEKIYTFSEEEVARMFKSGQMKLLTSSEPVQTQSDHEKALEKAKKLFGPDFKDVWTLEIGGNSAKQLKQKLIQSKVKYMHIVEAMLDNAEFTTNITPKNLEVIKLEVRNLGFSGWINTYKLYDKLEEMGLNLCPLEAGIYQRLKDLDQLLTDWYFIATKPILCSDFYSYVFCSSHHCDGYWLEGLVANPEALWASSHKFIASLSD